MNFRSEEVLALLVLVPVFVGLAVHAYRARLRATRTFGEPSTVSALIVGEGARFRTTRSILLVFGLALTIVALAGPQFGSRTKLLRKRGVDVVIALDFSKSMLAQDVRPSRIERAKAELGRLLEELDGDRVGLVAFAGETLEFPMTMDHAAVHLFLREMSPNDMPVGGTAIGRALVASKRMLERAAPRGTSGRSTPDERSRVVVLLTDGEDHEGDPMSAARELAEAGIKLITVGIGSRTGEPIPTFAPDGTWTGYLRDDEGNPITTAYSAENEKALRALAEATGGKHFSAGRGSVGVEKIRGELRHMKQGESEARRITVHEDRYAIVLLPAFLLIVLESLLPEAWLPSRRRRKLVGGGS